jgi:asparagine synthase (glutamine-hydrolysing)
MNSLEVRCPFLDYKLAEYVYNLPLEYKMDKKSGKIILKDILSEIMPKDFVYRRKQGFGAPVMDWLKTKKMERFVKENLAENANIYAYINVKPVKELLESFYSDKSKRMAKESKVFDKIWNLLCLELWFKAHKQYHE